MNEQIQVHDIMARRGCHVDVSITQSPHKPKTRPAYEVVSDREERDDEGVNRMFEIIKNYINPFDVGSNAKYIQKLKKILVHFDRNGKFGSDAKRSAYNDFIVNNLRVELKQWYGEM